MSRLQLRPAVMPQDLPVVRELFEEYAAGLGIDLAYQGWADELAGLPGKYTPPRGGLWLASVDEAVAGCVALRPFDAERAEIKRLYVRTQHRGMNLGRTLALHAIGAARDANYRRVCLDTLTSMTAAITLYRSLGFVEVPPYYVTPVTGTLFLSKDLTYLGDRDSAHKSFRTITDWQAMRCD